MPITDTRPDITRCHDASGRITRLPMWRLDVKPNGTVIATDPDGVGWRIAPWPDDHWTAAEQPFGVGSSGFTVHRTPQDAYDAVVTRSQLRVESITRAKARRGGL